MFSLRSARRRLAGIFNEQVGPRFGFQLVRSWPRTVSYKQLGKSHKQTSYRVSAGSEAIEVRLRPGTSDWMTFTQIFVDEDYDLRPLPRHRELQALYYAICNEGKRPLIVDLGANIGLSPLYFSLVWPEARVLAVEPDPDNYALLEGNVGQRPAVAPIMAGIAHKSGTLRIANPGAEKNAIRTTAAEGDGVTIRAITMAEVLAQSGDGAIPFIAKIDIEGGEADLFARDVDWIDDFPLIIIELHDWLYPGKRTSSSFLKAVAERDRDFVYLDENVFSIRNPPSRS